MHKIILIPVFFLAACSMSGTVVTMDSFQDVPIGMSANEVCECLGEPYSIHKCTDGAMEYEYIERITIGARYAEERHYYLLIKDGEVVSKRVKQSIPTPYTFDSYDMQTTQIDSTNLSQ